MSSLPQITDPSGQDSQLHWSSTRLVILGAITLALALVAIMTAATLVGQ
ncbi:MAG: hypothetical protein Q8Q09_08890 [Deltaproteobacteria bacterium]|nr:hypothetical protein [Deltaproteobacteria bacterium]